MSTYDFTLHLDREVTEDEADALYGAFDDGSIVTGPGGTTIDFTREAPSWAEAIVTAVNDIEGAVPGLRVTGAGQDDLVSALEIAQRTRRSREAVRLWAAGKRGPGGFPAPAWESPGGERFWRWPDVAHWARERMNLAVEIGPDEIRWADEVLKARQAMAEAQQILRDADAATRHHLGPLLEDALRKEVNEHGPIRLYDHQAGSPARRSGWPPDRAYLRHHPVLEATARPDTEHGTAAVAVGGRMYRTRRRRAR
jgi:hypothetical protein